MCTAQNTVDFFCIPEMVLDSGFTKQCTMPNFQNSRSRYFPKVVSPTETFLVFTTFSTLCPLGGTGLDRQTDIRHWANVLYLQEYRTRIVFLIHHLKYRGHIITVYKVKNTFCTATFLEIFR